MTIDNQRVYLDQLCKRWGQSADQVVEMAIRGEIELWFEFSNVSVMRVKKKKTAEPQAYQTIEARPATEALELMVGRTDRLQVAAEYSCFNAKGKPLLISNAVGDEWGETSMIGLNPMRLYAREDDLRQVERKKKIIPMDREHADSCCCRGIAAETDDGELIPSDHPCFAPELHLALECWLALMADQKQAEAVTKADILQWLRDHAPGLSKTAANRIALVVSPAPQEKQ
jgi:hypothetical protein